MDNRYQPKEYEHIVSQLWQDKFVADDKSDRPSFVMMMPPPNITGRLHMGHALNNTLQDSIARYKRMSGYNVLWLPGVDHASIATELKVVELLKSQGVDKQDLTREQFVDKCYEWKSEYGSSIVEQLKRLGCSVDWSRQAFTMDEQCSNAVKTVFVDLYNQGLIYRGDRIINWCVDCCTALSDAEVEYQDNEGNIWQIQYPVEGGGYIIVATTRPETMLGDTAIVVHPKDARYKKMVGKYATVPLVNRKIPILADTYVDKDFGTGVVKVTPAHDPNDFEIGQRHKLDSIKILTDDGHITGGTSYDGLQRNVARKQIVSDLDKLGLLVKVDKHNNNRGHCYRCNSVVEPMVSRQWFVKMQPLAQPAIEAVNDGSVQFVPKSYTKIYMHWMTNIKDWCISRQLYWGHRIPAWHCAMCEYTEVSINQVDKCTKCGGRVEQDHAVLDTWFSSALWPFSTLGYPNKTSDLSKFYPGALLVTAYDIIFFWVARMIFSGLHHMGQVPFDKVLIHGIVRASDGRKMSKSLGNGVDPIQIIDNYGTDSLRFCLLSGVALGSDIRYSEERLHKAQAFCNKVYNAARFVQHNMQDVKIVAFDKLKDSLTLADKWILTRLASTVVNIESNFGQYEIGRVADGLYNFVWDDFCDWYIEISKVQIAQDKTRAVSVLVYILGNILKILHPIIPYITEYLYNNTIDDKSILALQDYPKDLVQYEQVLPIFEHIQQLVVGIRTLRADNNVPSNKKINVYVHGFVDFVDEIKQALPYVARLAMCSQVVYLDKSLEQVDNIVRWRWSVGSVSVELGKVDSTAVVAKLKSDLDRANKELHLAQFKLSSEGFVSKAPLALIQAEQDKLVKYSEIITKLQQDLAKY